MQALRLYKKHILRDSYKWPAELLDIVIMYQDEALDAFAQLHSLKTSDVGATITNETADVGKSPNQK